MEYEGFCKWSVTTKLLALEGQVQNTRVSVVHIFHNYSY